MSRKRAAVTGGRGRLAPKLAGFLREHGWDVDLFSRTAGNDCEEIAELVSPENLACYDAVLHLGWSTVPLVAEENPGIEEREDLPLARAMVAAADACERAPQLVFFSTAAVYGNTDAVPADENTDCRPLGRYASAKLTAEKIFADAPAACVLRISNVFSAGCERTRPQGIIPLLIEAAQFGRPVTVWGDGNAVKDYISALDLNAAVLGAMERRLEGIFNVGSERVFSVNELIRLVEEASGRRISVHHSPHYSWDVERGIFSSKRLQQAIGWSPKIDPSEEIRLMAKLQKMEGERS